MALSATSPTASTTFWVGDQNQTKISSCFLAQNDWTFTFVPVYILLISVLGIVLNVFVLMVFCLHKKACTTPEIYLSNLAAADLLLVSFLPFWSVYVANRYNWTFGQAMCKIVSASILMNAYCSIYFLVLVSIDRYLALAHPMSYERIRRPVFAKLGCLLVWILGFLFSLPALIYRELTPPHNDRTSCFVNYPNTTINLTSDAWILVFGFIIPISIIIFCTVKIIQILSGLTMKRENIDKTNHKATTLALAVLLAFLICWVPYHLIKTLYLLRDAGILTVCNSHKILYICQQIFTYLAYFNSVLNPILYVIVGKSFQTKVKELFWQWTHKGNLTLNNPSLTTKLSRSVESEDDAV
ncbi:B2 bradykinin receptor-like isoform X2 [Kryptolebias marmoratus]|uniref:Bradykinin receptor B2 n=1 Tax=Kryptolebias marmoratus TaxID=37003 RepID=A0A3Q3ARZ9_KRYMA|nr:B2 bradykinin receptor-like isoform X2 [Kryptolebias marmoratus]